MNQLLVLTAIYCLPIATLILMISVIERRSALVSIYVAMRAVVIVLASFALLAQPFKIQTMKLAMNWEGHIVMTLVFLFWAIWRGRAYCWKIGLMSGARAKYYGEALLMGAIFAGIGLLLDKFTPGAEMARPPFWEKLAFELTLPGLGEELVFRGVLLTQLDDHFGFRFSWKGVKYGWGLFLVGVPFALVHMFTLDSSNGFMEILVTGVVVYSVSCGLAFLRRQSGSLWPCALAHNAINAMSFLISR